MRNDETVLNQRIGERIKLTRESRKVSQWDLAGHLEITDQQLQKIEKGVNRASAGRLFQIAEFLEQPIEIYYSGLRLEDCAGGMRDEN